MALTGKSHKELLSLVAEIIPPLKKEFHKGQAGRVAILGGCEDYTGAPYFSAIAATMLGADMSHVICERNAATVIKSYSPNLMVHPYLYDSSSAVQQKDVALKKVFSLLDRIHVLVVGPGLGRDEVLLGLAKSVIEEARKRQLPLVIDADGLYLIQNNIDVVKGYKEAVITPNVVEFKRLSEASGGGSTAEELSNKLGVVVLQKGSDDTISNGQTTLKNSIAGGLKRVSGQGDTLSGCLATFIAWKLAYQHNLWDHSDKKTLTNADLYLLAAYGASTITRTAARLAYETHGRGTLTTHIGESVGQAYSHVFGSLVEEDD